ncbi:hypothetical protein M427DRAFT_54305 [Gonapodya prolifera JEL478]|uniref:TLDc domain-containing protein n=1 Tax=Gonapodya prolifera (strain JEL478) TaxID=1344416 RepID=A0A139ALS2_GONPJ|nr:hypothetical protein M427DRAFT_54305 [Gonapodya prolifera JEL478]|eukprot:KXS17709.1 hypothetical protein M427DRAFT_54305 [Gonapodya prolifera JEL478]
MGNEKSKLASPADRVRSRSSGSRPPSTSSNRSSPGEPTTLRPIRDAAQLETLVSPLELYSIKDTFRGLVKLSARIRNRRIKNGGSGTGSTGSDEEDTVSEAALIEYLNYPSVSVMREDRLTMINFGSFVYHFFKALCLYETSAISTHGLTFHQFLQGVLFFSDKMDHVIPPSSKNWFRAFWMSMTLEHDATAPPALVESSAKSDDLDDLLRSFEATIQTPVNGVKASPVKLKLGDPGGSLGASDKDVVPKAVVSELDMLFSPPWRNSDPRVKHRTIPLYGFIALVSTLAWCSTYYVQRASEEDDARRKMEDARGQKVTAASQQLEAAKSVTEDPMVRKLLGLEPLEANAGPTVEGQGTLKSTSKLLRIGSFPSMDLFSFDVEPIKPLLRAINNNLGGDTSGFVIPEFTMTQESTLAPGLLGTSEPGVSFAIFANWVNSYASNFLTVLRAIIYTRFFKGDLLNGATDASMLLPNEEGGALRRPPWKLLLPPTPNETVEVTVAPFIVPSSIVTFEDQSSISSATLLPSSQVGVLALSIPSFLPATPFLHHLYHSPSHGSSLNRFLSHVGRYNASTILWIGGKVLPPQAKVFAGLETGVVGDTVRLGLVLDEAWKEKGAFGNNGVRIGIEIGGVWNVLRPAKAEKEKGDTSPNLKMALIHKDFGICVGPRAPQSPGSKSTTPAGNGGISRPLTPSQTTTDSFLLTINPNFASATFTSDSLTHSTFTKLPAPRNKEGWFINIDVIEVSSYGLGGWTAWEKQRKDLAFEKTTAMKRAEVNVRKAGGGIDRELLKMAGLLDSTVDDLGIERYKTEKEKHIEEFHAR